MPTIVSFHTHALLWTSLNNADIFFFFFLRHCNVVITLANLTTVLCYHLKLSLESDFPDRWKKKVFHGCFF